PAPRASAAADTASGGEYGPVQPGETLSGIAQRIRPPGMSTSRMLATLHAANPAAFIGGDVNRLRAGVRLQVPGETAVARPDTPAGTRRPARQGRSRKGRRRR